MGKSYAILTSERQVTMDSQTINVSLSKETIAKISLTNDALTIHLLNDKQPAKQIDISHYLKEGAK